MMFWKEYMHYAKCISPVASIGESYADSEMFGIRKCCFVFLND